MKPFPKSPQQILTITIDENGDLLYLKTDACDVLLEMGTVVTKRASHVEPATFWARCVFHTLRALVSDTSKVAAWTRTWGVAWRVNTAPVGGPILRTRHLPGNGLMGDDTVATWSNRQHAIDAEIQFLNDWFLERGIR